MEKLGPVILLIALDEEIGVIINDLGVEITGELSCGSITAYRAKTTFGSQLSEVILCLVGEMGVEETALATSDLIRECRPELLVNIGISGAISDDVALTDVVVSTEIDHYSFRGKIVDALSDATEDKELREATEFGGRALLTTDSLTRVTRNIRWANPSEWKQWVDAALRDRSSLVPVAEDVKLKDIGLLFDVPRVHVGATACGPSVIGSRAFKRTLLRRNRNFLAVDMESWGMLLANRRAGDPAKTLVIRGVSDPSDERKREIDSSTKGQIRAMAIRNAFHLLKIILVHADALTITPPDTVRAELEERLHRLAIDEYLPYPYDSSEYVNSVPKDYASELFSLLAGDPVDSERDFFVSLSDHVVKSTSEAPLRVDGQPGTGKTTLLALLYWKLLDLRAADPTLPLPVFFNVGRYAVTVPQRSRRGKGQPRDVLQQHLIALEEFFNAFPDDSVVVIVDGLDPADHMSRNTTETLLDACRTASHKKIIGVRHVGEHVADVTAVSPQRTICLSAVDARDPRSTRLLQVFSALLDPANPDDVARKIESLLSRVRVQKIDLFALAMLHDGANLAARAPASLSDLIESFCRSVIGRAAKSTGTVDALLNRASRMAFMYEVRNEIIAGDTDDDRLAWEVVRRHSQISDYLAARFVVQEFVKIGRRDKQERSVGRELKYVYPYRINRFCKEILTKDERTQVDVFAGIKSVLQNAGSHKYAKAHACYLAGRIEYSQFKQPSLQLLRSFHERLHKSDVSGQDTDSKLELLLFRTVHISLAYLGDDRAQQEYVEGLLANRRWDRFNRGFHLEYYGDQVYTPAEALLSDDELRPCPFTFEQLYGRLSRGEANPLFEIEVQTLFSLAQHRHAIGALAHGERERLRALAGDLLHKRIIRTPKLRTYIGMVSSHLGNDNFRVATIFDELYNLKSVKRSGWVKRGISEGETVTDHTTAAQMLALTLLPEEWKGVSYSKGRVMKILLIHDWAEARLGDYLPEERTEFTAKKERAFFEELAMLATYEGLSGLAEVRTLWEEFEDRSTPDGQVARDVDKLENLVQLWKYRAVGLEIPDYESFRDDLKEDVGTDPGLFVLEKLMQIYSDFD